MVIDQVCKIRSHVEEGRDRAGGLLRARRVRATGPAVLMIPLRGSSAISVNGAPFHDPVAGAALAGGLRERLAGSDPEVLRLDADINPVFSQAAAARPLAIPEGNDRAEQE